LDGLRSKTDAVSLLEKGKKARDEKEKRRAALDSGVAAHDGNKPLEASGFF
jgi:hypothetical protein